MSLMSRNKGKSGERELCKLLRASLGDISFFERNSMQAHGLAKETRKDILCRIPFSIEVKRTEDFAPTKWLKQAREQSTARELPVVAHRSNGEPWKFMMELTGAEFCRVARAVHMFNSLPKEVQTKLLAQGDAVGSDNLLTHEGDE